MSRDYRPYSSASSRPHRAESWQPDRPHGGGRGDRGGDYGDLGDYGDHQTGYDQDASRARRYAGSYAAGRSSHQVLDDPPRTTNRYATYDHAPHDHGRYDQSRYDDRDEAVDYPRSDDEDRDDDEIYEYYEPIDRRWVWVAGVAAAILLIAVLCTVVILGGGDSGSVSATVNPPLTSEPAATRTPPPSTSARPAPPVASLPAETVTTVAPTPTATLAPPPPPVAAAPVAPAPAANTVTYTISGTRSLIDLVTVIYTDAQGALQTDLNVALPWRKTIVLDPGVSLSSVTATSVTGQLNCSITDPAGVALAAQNSNSIITTCTR